MGKILLVEDDESFGYLLKEYLEINDFEVTWERDGADGLTAFNERLFDLCILDVMMPVKDGFTLAREIQDIDCEVPFIFLTAKALKTDKLRGFRLGCDDYVVKPIDEELFIARVRAIINRVHRNRSEGGQNTIDIGGYIFDFPNQTLKNNNKTQRLTTKEAKVLKLLCERKNQVLDRDKVLKIVWGKTDFFKRKSMDVFIHKLRKYLDEDPSVKIRNIHGKGFVLEEEGSA